MVAIKKLLPIILLFGLLFLGCASTNNTKSQTTETLYEWGAYSIPPSQISLTGDIVMRSAPYADGAYCIVFYDSSLAADASFYYAKINQDFGWTRDVNGNWTGNGYSRRTQEGAMYVNPVLKVAIYFYPGNKTYGVFRVIVIHD